MMSSNLLMWRTRNSAWCRVCTCREGGGEQGGEQGVSKVEQERSWQHGAHKDLSEVSRVHLQTGVDRVHGRRDHVGDVDV